MIRECGVASLESFDRAPYTHHTPYEGEHRALGSPATVVRVSALCARPTVGRRSPERERPRRIAFRFREDEGQRRFLFQNDAPDRDYFFNLTVGLVLVLERGIAPFVNYRTLLGYREQQSHTVTAGVRFEF